MEAPTLIKIRTSSADLVNQVAEQVPRWKRLASEHTSDNMTAGHHVHQSSNIWSLVKDAFKSAQLYKCAYCESGLGKRGIRWQIEHYRPKARVDVWKSALTDFGDFTDQPPSADGGYYLLAYDIGNYLASCESCNNPKHNYFPVREGRQQATADSSVLALEQPLIINPIDAHDEDPEELIEFDGPIPRPAARLTCPARQRALATIEVLNLEREDLVLERSGLIFDVWLAFQTQNAPDKRGEIAKKFLERLDDDGGPHRNCMRSFLRLCGSNPGRAAALAEAATELI